MSLAITVEGISSKKGLLHITGTMDFTTSSDPGEEVVASDFDSSLTKLLRVSLTPKSGYEFIYAPSSVSGGTIKILQVGSPVSIVKQTAVTLAGVMFEAVGFY